MLQDYVILCLAAMAGGAVNAVAGGGTLLTFPALFGILGTGNGIVANATSTVALVPGALAAVAGYRREVCESRRWITVLFLPSLIGGWVGALLLTRNSDSSFERLVPWLILTAALLFALQPTIARWTGIGRPHEAPSWRTAGGVVLFQFLVAIYGGYFGAGIGILMLAALAMMGLADIHAMNGLKSFLGVTINSIAAAQFIYEGRVDWRLALPMTVAALVGGYGAAAISRRLDRRLVRNFVIVVGFALAAYYFYKQYAAR